MQTYGELIGKAEELKKAGQHESALGLLSYIHAADPESDHGINAAMLLSGIYKDLGQMDKAYLFMKFAVEQFEKRGNTAAAGSSYASLACGALYTPGVTLAAYTELTKRFSVSSEPALPKISHLNHDFTIGRKLKVGILTPDLCMHSLAYLVVQPLINFQKLTGHELHIYHLRSHSDNITENIIKSSTSFVRVSGWSDDQITKKIVEDKIDVLIDISGFTAETRLSVFMRQPAPVQMGWISGMMTPTGLQSIPYFLTDKYMKPDVVPTDLCTPIMVTSALTYHTLREKELEIEGQPCDRNGYISFGSFNNPCKINKEVLGTWADILRNVPKSRLHLKTYHPLDTARIHEFMAKSGVDPQRLTLLPTLPSSTDVQTYYSKHVDIFLDAWPCSGCLTTVEALWMGVPVISYYTDVFCSRQSHSILNNTGITDLSVSTLPGYVRSAIDLSNDTGRIRKLRKGLREMMTVSPLHNYGNMAIELGKAVESAWTQNAELRKNTLDILRKAA